MKTLKLLITSALTWSLVYTPTVFPQTPMSDDSIEDIISSYNKEIKDNQSLIRMLEKHNKKRAEEFKKYIGKSKASLPHLAYSTGMIEFNSHGDKWIVSPYNNGEFKITTNNKSTVINQSMSIMEIEGAISDIMTQAVSYSITDFIISPASAIVIAVLEVVAVLVAVLAWSATMASMDTTGKKKFDHSEFDKTFATCENQLSTGITTGQMQEVKNNIKILHNMKDNAQVDPENLRYIDRSLSCLNKLSQSKVIDDSSRTKSKKIEVVIPSTQNAKGAQR